MVGIILCFLAIWMVQGGNIPNSELMALEGLYNATNGPLWSWNSEYNPIQGGIAWNFSQANPNPCTQSWQGIDCATCKASSPSCHVHGLALEAHNLTGTLPASLSDLTYLEVLVLPNNPGINGSIPESWASFRMLRVLDLRQDSLDGTLPDWIPQLPSLRALNLSSNYFRDGIPDSYYTMSNISSLSLQANFLGGTLSGNVAGLTNCSLLELAVNQFTGTLPAEIGQMPSLQYLRLSFNEFHGTIPASMGNISTLLELYLSSNFLEKSIPLELGNLTNLEALYLGENFLTGSFPHTIANCSRLSLINIGYGYLTGSIPDAFGTNPNLAGLFMNNNLFHGTLPSSMANLQVLDAVEFSTNLFSGRLDTVFVGMPLMNYFWMSDNLFTGYLPSSHWSQLFLMDVGFNQLSGPVPPSFDNLQVLNNLVMAINLLSGTIPSDLLSISVLNLCSLGTNVFSGSIPDVFPVGSQLKQLILSDNFLSGSLPGSLINLTIVAEIDVSYNKLSGSLPAVLSSLANLNILFLSNNQFTGNLEGLVNITTQQHLANLDLSHNYFTGRIPVAPFYIAGLNSFAISSNCLHGSLPSDICNAQNLSVLVFDGIATATRCRRNLFAGISYLNAFVLRNVLTGTIPECLFALPNMRTLHLSGNGLTGTLPANLSLSLVFTDLVISHNALSGTIPNELQAKSMRVLDLSYNRFGGTLIDDFADALSNSSYYMQVNRLSGTIPKALQSAPAVSMLDGNIFYCDALRNELPAADPQTPIYICGSDGVNESLYAWLGTLGFMCLLLAAALVYVLYWKKLLAWNEFWLTLRAKWRKMDDALRRFSAEPLSVEPVSSSNPTVEEGAANRESNDSAAVAQAKESGINQESFAGSNNLSICASAIASLVSFFDHIRRLFFLITAFTILAMVPLYTGFSHYTSTYEVSYGWQISGVLLSGRVASLMLVIGFGFVMLNLMFFLLETVRKFEQSNTVADGIFNQKIIGAARETSRLLAFAVLNMAVMIAVDCAYVYIFINFNTTTVLITQLSMAAFKIFWNEIVLWLLIPLTKVNWWKAVANRHRSSRAHSTNAGKLTWFAAFRLEMLRKAYSVDDVRFLAFNVLLNNIVVPAVAIACISTTCFNNALIAAPAVTDTYVIDTCVIYIANEAFDECLVYVPNPNTIAYDPPFLYSYQCASMITINYAPVFIYMFIALGIIIPFGKLTTHSAYYALPDGPWKAWMTSVLPEQFLPPSMDKVGKVMRLFAREKSVVKMINYLAIIIAFGTIYPPITVLGCLTLFAVTYTEQYMLGHMLCAADVLGLKWYRDELGRQCVGIEHLFRLTVWQVIPFAVMVLGYLIFDTFGYSNGWEGGIFAIGMFILWPMVASAAYFGGDAWMTRRKRQQAEVVKQSQHMSMTSSRGGRSETISDSWEVELSMVNNPLSDSTQHMSSLTAIEEAVDEHEGEDEDRDLENGGGLDVEPMAELSDGAIR